MSIDKTQMTNAINAALAEFHSAIRIDNLNSDKTTDGSIGCTQFAGAVYEKAGGKDTDKSYRIKINNLTGDELKKYKNGDLVNILLDYDNWDYTHACCIYFSSDTSYVIQTYLNHTVRIVTSFEHAVLNQLWYQYAETKGGNAEVFNSLFSVKPVNLPNVVEVIITELL
ncbi:hypothetical protein [Serratia proteamaculans]|uniref:hypothetical protein n=1 Tax=Serratia proteamaculans TaxID=28151 RepID=UPI002182B815|nr:hypothetical protein [Serratia proteamaculans]CAI2425581.1 Uncharacterised protein [Serratia proteamaculans]